jgi:Cupin domain
MPHCRKDEAPIMVDEPVIEGRYVDLDDWTVSFETFPVGSDPAPLFRGLPDDRCQCPHWGYVLRGEITVRYADGASEVLRAGDAYYLPAGHLTVLADDTEVVEFSPREELAKTMAVVGANMQAGVPQ